MGSRRLQRAELLYDTAVGPDRESTFKHILTQEVAYGSLLPEQRRLLHARIVDSLEVLYPDRRAEDAATLAHHAVRGEVWDKAVDYLREAGAHAFARGSVEGSLACYDQALTHTDRLVGSSGHLERAIDVRLDFFGPLVIVGQVPRLVELQREAEALARQLGDPSRLGRVLYRGAVLFDGRTLPART